MLTSTPGPAPSAPPELLRRAVLEYPVTLLVAPAGWGKSALLRRWAAQCPAPVAWVSLTADENDDTRFLAGIVQAMHGIAGQIAIQEESWGECDGTMRGAEAMVGRINVLADANVAHVLVLDEYHLIASPTVCEMVTLLLDYPLPLLHLLIAARAEPPLPLPRLRARGQLYTLDYRPFPGKTDP